MLEGRAQRHELGRHVGMVIDANVIARQHARQCGSLERLRVHDDRWIVRPQHASKHRVELVVAVDEDGFHGSFRAPRWREV